MAKDYKDLVVGLDIGTAKVMVVVAEVLPGGELKLAGLGIAPSNGLKRGVVVNIDATVQSIQQALKEAELMADCKITRVYTGITGAHIRGINSSGMVAVKDREVTPRFKPLDGAMPSPASLSSPPGMTSATTAITLAVPMSSPTTRSL